MHQRIRRASGALVLLASLGAHDVVVLAQTQRFEDHFDGLGLNGVEPFASPDWDVLVHSRARETFFQLEEMQAAHGLDGSPPPSTHTIREYEDAVYVAREHLMTAVNAEAYALVYLTPTALADWSAGECVIRFDVSTLRTSRRDWIDVWLTPWEDNMVHPLDHELPDLQGHPRNGLQFRMSTWRTIWQGTDVDWSHFRALRFDDYAESILPFSVNGYEQTITPSARQRRTIELRISKTHVRMGVPELNLWWIDTPIAELGFDCAVVQFGHHSYNPTKPGGEAPIAHDVALAGTPDPSANTWHWDAFEMRPAIPFTRHPGNRRFVLGDTLEPVEFAAPAPRNASLRFSAIGDAEVSFDRGPFQPALRQDGSREAAGQHEDQYFASFWTPVPEGTQTVRVRLTPRGVWANYGFDTVAKNFSIWALPEPIVVPGGPETVPGPVRRWPRSAECPASSRRAELPALTPGPRLRRP
ncbi:MAG: hypothetical protein AAF726_12120 [Planctomycetota bacterium]